MPSRDAKRVIDTLVTARPMLVRAYGANACVICTRIAVEVCRERRIPAAALPVAVDVENDVAVARLGFSEDGVLPGNVNFHLVALIDRTSLLDLTIDQINDPHVGLEVGPVVLAVGKDFRNGSAPVTTTQNGVQLTYTAYPADRQYLRTEDWGDGPERERVMRLLR